MEFSAAETYMSRVNFDSGGNSRVTALGRSAYLQALEDGWGDHRRLHTEGRKARAIFDASRETVAGVLGVRTEEVRFAPSATHAIHEVVRGISAGRARVSDVALLTASERSATINAAQHYGRLELVPVNDAGFADVSIAEAMLSTSHRSFIAVQHANHEVGTVQSIAAFSNLAAQHRTPLLVDATSTLGHIAPPDSSDWDALVANPADWGAGSGVGVLALKQRTRVRRAWPEDQDDWFPGGTSLAAIFAAAVTLSEAESQRVKVSAQQFDWIDRIRAAVSHIPDTEIVGDPVNRLPHLSTFSFLYVDGEAITTELDKMGFAVGSGSACTSATLAPSHVLAAMGVLTHGNVRVSLDWDVSESDVDRFIKVIPEAVRNVRALMGVDDL